MQRPPQSYRGAISRKPRKTRARFDFSKSIGNPTPVKSVYTGVAAWRFLHSRSQAAVSSLISADGHRFDLDQQVLEGKSGDTD